MIETLAQEESSVGLKNLDWPSLRGSKAKDLREFAETCAGDDIRECLELVHHTRMPLELSAIALGYYRGVRSQLIHLLALSIINYIHLHHLTFRL